MDKLKVIRRLSSEEIESALSLVWAVFEGDCAPHLTKDEVLDSLALFEYEYILHRFGDGSIDLWGAFENGELVGVCGMMDRRRIIMLFVARERQGCGIGGSLIKKAALDCRAADDTFDIITAQVFYKAAPFFEKHGFTAFDTDGGFVSMTLKNE